MIHTIRERERERETMTERKIESGMQVTHRFDAG
jgi:hypothetical protein